MKGNVVGLGNFPVDIKMIIVVPYYDIEKIKRQVIAFGVDVKLIEMDEYIRGRYLPIHK